MEVLRSLGQFSLNKGDGAARGMYNVTNQILLDYTEEEGCSLWFGEETKDNLMILGTSEFIARAKQYAGNNIYSEEIKDNMLKELTNSIKDGILAENVKNPFRSFYKGETLVEIKLWVEKTFK